MSLGDDHDGRTSEGFGGSGQTRTRLPGSAEADVYGGARRPVRSSRSLIGVVGVVVLLVAAIAFANRGGDEDGAAKGNASNPEAAPTAATGVRPVKGLTGDIPTGYAQDEQGAQSAAANYAVALVSADILNRERRSAIVRQIFVAGEAAELERKLDEAYSKEFLSDIGLDANGNAPTGMTYVSRTAPVGTLSKRFTTDTATIEVWCTGVFGMAGVSSTNPVTNDWFTMTLNLRWATNDWKVESFSQKDGPAPVNADRTASSAEEITKAVEQYGGFTYAR
ncbi:hypothetical protein [Streptomyces sanyensis]|uniref:DUF8175 domain-containing protein n=1 Tax=Streptomyces sanyensis TaxID=568869 RepID=A0ABP9ABS6_9ACTN